MNRANGTSSGLQKSGTSGFGQVDKKHKVNSLVYTPSARGERAAGRRAQAKARVAPARIRKEKAKATRRERTHPQPQTARVALARMARGATTATETITSLHNALILATSANPEPGASRNSRTVGRSEAALYASSDLRTPCSWGLSSPRTHSKSSPSPSAMTQWRLTYPASRPRLLRGRMAGKPAWPLLSAVRPAPGAQVPSTQRETRSDWSQGDPR